MGVPSRRPPAAGGFLLGLPPLVMAAGAAFALMAAFALVSLPVELDASRRALDALRRTGIASADELRGVRAVLRAAAFTYVTKLAGRVGLLLFLVGGVVSVAQMGWTARCMALPESPP